ncbi:MAG: acyl-CoA dehydrogenase family protein [Betaproteobacteria bacterium]|nr:acyl-CoA dehydrogenase family protein [Betaproteobacteria bacterium]
MDVLLNDDENLIVDSAREFLTHECPTKLVREMETDPLGYSKTLWAKVAELGWQGMCLPEKVGGSAMSLVYLGLVLREAGRTLAPIPLHSTAVATLAITKDGTPAQQEKYLPDVVVGKTVWTWAFTEKDPRFVPEAVQMSARAEGDGFVLDGTKLFVDNFPAADYCLVVARSTPGSSGAQGLSLFIVDAKAAGISHNVLITLAKDKQCEVNFKGVKVPKANVIGPVGDAWPIIERMLDRGTALLCAQMVGAARKDIDMAIEYAKFRTAFGQPIGAFQSVQHMCADMQMWVDGGELLTFEALWKLEQGLHASVEVSQAKSFCNEKCEAAVRQSQSIHGGIGFMMEFDLQLWFRRVSAWSMRMGTSFEHRARIARALIDVPGEVTLGRPLPGTPGAETTPSTWTTRSAAAVPA